MQYIKKQNTPPKDWDSWFLKGDGGGNTQRTYIYTHAEKKLKKYLLQEQNQLCAYCQKEIAVDSSTVEHIFPQSLNQELSTNYHNLVLVCSGSTNGEKHCDKSRGNQFIINLIFSNLAGLHIKNEHDDLSISHLTYPEINALWAKIKVNLYFDAYADGTITIKTAPKENQNEPYLNTQIDAFINILNLNHSSLKTERKKAIESLDAAKPNQAISKADINKYWKQIFFKILKNRSYPYRQFLLLYLASNRKLNLG